jgi:N-acetylglutamate synthase-like GNAT family acetyltransferase
MKDERFGVYTLSCKRDRFKTGEVMALLALTYWAKDRDRDTVRRCMRHSTSFGVFGPDGALVGFLRVTSDHCTVFYLADVVVAEAERGKGLGLALVKYALAHPKVCRGKGMLLTQTATGLYEKVGFHSLNDRLMVRDPEKPYAAAVQPQA